MLQTRVQTRTAPQSFSTYSNVFGLALVSTALLGQPIAAPDFLRQVRRTDIRIHSHADASYQLTTVSEVSHRDSLAQHGATWHELEALGANWDGQGAEPVSRKAIEHAQAFLALLGPQGKAFEPFADPDGSVGLEARKGSGAVAYIVVSESGRFAYVLRKGARTHRGSEVEQADVLKILDLLY